MTNPFTLDHFKTVEVSTQEQHKTRGGVNVTPAFSNFTTITVSRRNVKPNIGITPNSLILDDLVDIRTPIITTKEIIG